MVIRLFKAEAGAFVVQVKHARVLKLRSATKHCKDRAAVVLFVQEEVELEEGQHKTF